MFYLTRRSFIDAPKYKGSYTYNNYIYSKYNYGYRKSKNTCK